MITFILIVILFAYPLMCIFLYIDMMSSMELENKLNKIYDDTFDKIMEVYMKKTDSFKPENITITIGGVELKPYVIEKYYNIELVQTGDNSYEIKTIHNYSFGSNSFKTESEANNCIEWIKGAIKRGAFNNYTGVSIDFIINSLVFFYKQEVLDEEANS